MMLFSCHALLELQKGKHPIDHGEWNALLPVTVCEFLCAGTFRDKQHKRCSCVFADRYGNEFFWSREQGASLRHLYEASVLQSLSDLGSAEEFTWWRAD